MVSRRLTSEKLFFEDNSLIVRKTSDTPQVMAIIEAEGCTSARLALTGYLFFNF